MRPPPGGDLAFIAFPGSREMHDALGAGDGRLNSLTCDQVTTCILDALGGHVALPAEHSHAMPGVAQPRNDEPPEGTGAAGNQKSSQRFSFAILGFTVTNGKIIEIGAITDPERVERIAAAVIAP